ncbi:MAG: ABC transporter ATP-binding protein [Planctomycetota bacterium]
MTGSADSLLRVKDLTVLLETRSGQVPVVRDVSFRIGRGRTYALVGESGCGKSVTALSLLRLLDPPLAASAGAIELEGLNLLDLPPARMRAIRGRKIAMIFQEPMTALNPVLTVGEQVAEVLRLHLGMSRRQARNRSVELFREVGIPDPEQRVREYPHRLSGGMRQRVMIAMALACDPLLLIADEATTALDVTVQAQILDLLARAQEERGMSILLITHDLGVVAELAHDVGVMYAGRIVEEAHVEALFEAPSHPYTRGLFDSLPEMRGPSGRLRAIPGVVPEPGERDGGCSFRPRCEEATEACAVRPPPRVTRPDAGYCTCFQREGARVPGGQP